MKGGLFLGGLLACLLLALPAESYEWYAVPIDSVSRPVYDLQFGGELGYAGTEAGPFRGYFHTPWDAMGPGYPGLGARTLFHREGSGWNKQVLNIESMPGATGVAVGDVDQSGYPDIIVAAKDPSDQVVWFENPLPGPAAPPWPNFNVDAPAWGAREVFLGDIDRDNDLDIAAALRDEDRIVWYRAETDTNPLTWTRWDVGPAAGPRGVCLADINGDDRLDIVAGAMNSGRVTWFEGPPDPPYCPWIEHVIDEDLVTVKGVFACDLDLDGDLDVIAAGRDIGHVVWYEQMENDPPTWEKHLIDTDLPGAVSVWCGDLTGDRLPEVAVAAKTAGWVVVYAQTDDSDVWERVVIDDDLAQACPISAGDFNGDGRMDLVAAGKLAGVVAWYEAPEEGLTWRKHVIDDEAGGSMGITAGDLDDDGDWDVVATSCPEGYVTWYENDLRDIYCGFTDGTGFCESDGVYRWRDVAEEWEPVWWCARPFFIEEHPLLPGTFLSGNHDGLFASSDLIEWQELGAAVLPDTVRCIWFHPTDPLSVFVGTAEGMYRSLPFEPGWERVTSIPPIPVSDIRLVEPLFGPPLAAVFAAVGMGIFSDGVFRSDDLGETFDRVLTFPEPTVLIQDLTAQEEPIVLFVGTAADGILTMNAAGEILGDLNDGLPNMTIHHLGYDPFIDTYALYAGTQEGLHLCMLLEFSEAPEADMQPPPALCRTWPNPWRTEVAFALAGVADNGPVRLRIFDVGGREVWASPRRPVACQEVAFTWSGRDAHGRPLPPGTYFYRIDGTPLAVGGKLLRIR